MAPIPLGIPRELHDYRQCDASTHAVEHSCTGCIRATASDDDEQDTDRKRDVTKRDLLDSLLDLDNLVCDAARGTLCAGERHPHAMTDVGFFCLLKLSMGLHQWQCRL